MNESRALRHSVTKAIRGCNNANLSRDAIQQAFAKHGLVLSSDEEIEEWLTEDKELDQTLFGAERKVNATLNILSDTAMKLEVVKRVIDDMMDIKDPTSEDRRDAAHDENSAKKKWVMQVT